VEEPIRPRLSHLPHSGPVCTNLDAVSWFFRNLQARVSSCATCLTRKLTVPAGSPSKAPTSCLTRSKPSQTYIRRGSINCSLQLRCYLEGSPCLLCFSHQSLSISPLQDPTLLESSLHHCPCMTQSTCCSSQRRGLERSVVKMELSRRLSAPLLKQPAESQKKQSLPRRVDAVAEIEHRGR